MEQLDPGDADRIRACFRVFRAAERVDEPEGPWLTERPFGGWLTVGWGGDPREIWLVLDRDSVVGWYRLELPDKENSDQASLDLVVHPAQRRRGLGRGLLRHAAARAAAHGRTVLNGQVRNGSAGQAFCRSAAAIHCPEALIHNSSPIFMELLPVLAWVSSGSFPTRAVNSRN